MAVPARRTLKARRKQTSYTTSKIAPSVNFDETIDYFTFSTAYHLKDTKGRKIAKAVSAE